MLATTGIKQVGGRRVLERIVDSGKVFFAVSDRDWVLDGAAVRICMVGFGGKDSPGPVVLDGAEVAQIHVDLTAGHDLTSKKRLTANLSLCFMGVTKVGDFDIEHQQALQFLSDSNPHGRPNSDVLRPFRNGSDLVRLNSNRWIIDFGVEMLSRDAALYAAPFEYLVQHVKPGRQKNGRAAYRERWWIHGEARPRFRRTAQGSSRYIATARVAKHRIFVWLNSIVLPDSKVIAIARQDNFSFGVVQSRLHEIWTLANCGWHGKGNDATYNPTTCFETFPFPHPTDPQREATAHAAAELDRLRSNWLNPPEWVRQEVLEFPGSVDGPWARYVYDANEQGIGTVYFPRQTPKDEQCSRKLAKRTLTNLYNDRPAWLDMAHRKLDETVFAAYGWEADMSEEAILAALLRLNRDRTIG